MPTLAPVPVPPPSPPDTRSTTERLRGIFVTALILSTFVSSGFLIEYVGHRLLARQAFGANLAILTSNMPAISAGTFVSTICYAAIAEKLDQPEDGLPSFASFLLGILIRSVLIGSCILLAIAVIWLLIEQPNPIHSEVFRGNFIGIMVGVIGLTGCYCGLRTLETSKE